MKKAEHLERVSSTKLDKVLGKPFKVLDDGFVRVVDYMGTDTSIVQAARVSYGKGTKTKSSDRGLIRYLIRHEHTSPFEMCELKLHVRVPMDCWRQWIRHRTANVNEYSTRYSVAIDSTYQTKPSEWRFQSIDNKQGSGGKISPEIGRDLSAREKEIHQLCHDEYNRRLELGVAREQARKDLPLSTYTEAYWKIDLQNLLRFLELRMDSKAQYEIRTYAETIGNEIVKRWCPLAWEAFMDYRMNSFSLSEQDQQLISAISAGKKKKAVKLAEEYGFISNKDGQLKKFFECHEVETKLMALGLEIPWN